jgi:hypothetical protein
MTIATEAAADDPPSKAGAVESLATLPDMSAAELGGVLLISGDNDVLISQLQPTPRAAPALIDVTKRVSDGYRECEVIDYGPAASTVGDQIMWVPIDSVPLLETILDDSSDLSNIEEFDPKTMKIAKSRMAAIRAEVHGSAVVFVQALRGGQVVARSSRFGVLVKKGVIDVPEDDILLLGRDVTAMVFKSYVFFSDRSSFQRLFNMLEELQAQAAATFAEVTSELEIDGLDTMLAAVTSHPSMLGKMASIQRKLDQYPQYKAAMTMPKLLKFARGHPEYQVDLSGEGDDAKLVFRNDPQHRFKILKLLDDDYLQSQLTDLEYEANSKGPPVG